MKEKSMPIKSKLEEKENKIYSFEELLSMPIIAKGTPESIKKDIRKELKRQEKLTNKEH